MSVPDPDHLLDQADRLIMSTGAGTARHVDLRRAISAAYYALFHAVTTEAADDLVGKTHRQTPRYMLVYRSVAHRGLRRLCNDIVKDSLPGRYSGIAPDSGFGADLQFFAAALVELQDRRHRADYDPLFSPTRSNAVLAVQRSKAALARLREADRALRRAFLTLAIFSPRQAQQEPET
jgi:uncharacterized protein (UPF0332 family)